MRVQTSDGVTIELGTLETAPTIGITDYSRRETDDFGITTVVERGFARRMSVRLSVPFENVDLLQRRLADLRAQPALWIADDSLASLRVTGFFKDFSLDLSMPPISYCTLTIEGLTDGDQIVDAGGDPAPNGAASTLLMLQPVQVTDSILTSSTVQEADHAEWASVTSYALGTRIIRSATHRIYESLVAANLSFAPETNAAQWLDVGPTNRWAMFDQALGSFTASPASIVVTLAAGVTDAIALLDVTGSTVRVQAGAYDRTLAVLGSTVAFLDLGGTTTPITVTVTPAGQAAVGTLLVGKLCALGVTEASPSAGITDYSRKNVDDFGDVTIVERAWAKKMTAASLIQTAGVDDVMARMIAVRARPALWIGQAGLETLTIYGFFKDFSIEVGETLSKLSLSIEGLSQAGKPQPLMVEWPNVADPIGTKPDDNATVGGTIGVDIKYGPDGLPVPPSLILNDALVLTPAGQLQYFDALGAARSLGTLRLDATGLHLTPAGQLQYSSALGETITIGSLKLEDFGAASAASNQQLGRDLDRVARAVQTALNEASRTRTVFTNAGFVVDPVTGVVTISAIQQTADTVSEVSLRLSAAESAITARATLTYVDNKIALAMLDPSQVPIYGGLELRISTAEFSINALNSAVSSKASNITVGALGARVTSAESNIDALNGQILTKVESSDFNRLGAQVASAVQTLSAIGDSAAISSAISVSRSLVRDADAAAKSALGALLNGDLTRQTTIAAIATARQELTAKINDDGSAAASERLALALRVASAEAQAISETAARIDAIGVLVSQITQLTATLGDTGAAVTSEAAARAAADGTLTAGLSDNVALSRTLGSSTAAAGASALSALLTGDATKRTGGAALAAARDELTAKINGDVDVVVQRVTALLARMGLSEASLVAEQAVRAAGDSALAQSILTLTATVGDNTAGIQSANVARVDGDQALADRIDTTNARVGAAEAATVHEVQARADGDTALAGEIDQLSGRVGDAEATATRDRQARVDGDGALADALDTLNARVGGAEATAVIDRQARVDGDGALASEIEQLSARLGSSEASVRTETQARADADGALSARVDTLSAQAGANTSNLTNETQARADADSALAARVNTLKTTQDGHSATITEQAASINGLEARFSLDIDVNGHAVGYVANNDGKRGDLTFTFDRTRILRPDGTLLFRAGSASAGEDPSVVYMPNVVVDRLKINTAVVPAFVSMNTTIDGPGWSDAAGDGGGSGGSTGPNKDLG